MDRALVKGFLKTIRETPENTVDHQSALARPRIREGRRAFYNVRDYERPLVCTETTATEAGEGQRQAVAV